MSRRTSAAVAATDAAVQSAIEARLLLNEERAFLPLCKAIYALFDNPDDSDLVNSALQALDTFEQLEVAPNSGVSAALEAHAAHVNSQHSAAASTTASAVTETLEVTQLLTDVQRLAELRTSADLAAAAVNRKFVDPEILENISASVNDLRSNAKIRSERTKAYKRKIDFVLKLAQDIKS